MKKSILFSLFVLLLFSCTKDKVKIAEKEVNCDDTISFNTQVLNVIEEKCFSCHNAGQSPTLNNHETIASNASLILKTLKADGSPLMPLGGPALDNSFIEKFTCWINQGKLNN
jgi:hypothetical protein